MSQLSFDLGGPEPLPSEDAKAPNLFYALRPDAAVKAEIMASADVICRREGLKPPRSAAVLHLTLCKIGNYGHSPSVIETARRIGSRVIGKACKVTLTRSMHFRGADAVVLATDETSAELSALNGDLVRALRCEGFKVPASFKPHVTFVYEGDRIVPEAELSGPINWQAAAFELVSSPPGQTRHEVLGRWPLL